MTKKEEKKSIIEICPIRNVVARFGNKWALLVVVILDENGSTRFNQLARQIPDISTHIPLLSELPEKRFVLPVRQLPISVAY